MTDRREIGRRSVLKESIYTGKDGVSDNDNRGLRRKKIRIIKVEDVPEKKTGM